MFFINIARNIAILLALCMGYTMIFRNKDRRSLSGRILAGVVFGTASVIGMLTPVTFAPGIIFDGRSILISIAGLFAGGLPALIAATIASVCRIAIGGPGTSMGCGVIVTSAVLGAAYHHLRRRNLTDIKTFHLLLFGLAVHIAMLLWTIALPEDVRWQVLRTIALPVLLVYPIGTVLVGRLLADQDARSDASRHLHESEQRYRSISEDMPVLICRFLPNFKITYVNKAYCSYFRKTPEELVGKSFLSMIPEDDREAVVANISLLSMTEPIQSHEHQAIAPDGDVKWQRWTNRALFDSEGQVIAYQSIGEDITERMQYEKERELILAILIRISSSNDKHELIQQLTSLLQHWSGCEAVGVRLREGEDFPYFETRGFPQEFVIAENYLCAKDIKNELQRDSQGNPVLECMCGNVLCGRFDPHLPFFTENGSFWSNNTTELLASTTEADRQARTRNRCHGEGYESVALIPIRHGDQMLGLIQFNDKRKGRFTPKLIAFMEETVSSVSVVLEQRLTQDKLNESEKNFRQLSETIHEVFWLGSPDWSEIHYISPAYEEIWGRSCQSLYNEPLSWIDAVHEDDRDFVLAEIKRKIRKDSLGQEIPEYRVVRSDGSIRWIFARAYEIHDENGQVIRIAGIAEDVTTRKQAEEALRDSQAHLEKAQKVAHVGSWEHNLQTDDLWWTKEVYEIFGVNADGFDGKVETFFVFVHPNDLESVKESIQAAIKDDKPYRLEHRIVRSDGEMRWVYEQAEIIRDKNGNPLKMIGTVRDITERKQQENLLAARVRLSEFSATHTITELLQAFLDEAEVLTGSDIGFFHFLDKDQVTLTLQTWSTNTLQNMCNAEGQGQHYSIDEAGVWVDCVRERQPVIHNDYARLTHKKGMPEGHAPVIRELVVPVFRDNHIVAILGMGNKKSAYNENDIKKVSTLADMAWDLVVRKQTEEALHESEERYRSISEDMPVLICRFLPGFEITYVNKVYCSYFDKTPEELLGKTFLSLILEDDRETVTANISSLSLTSPIQSHEHQAIAMDGDIRWQRWTNRALFDSEGQVIAYQSIGEDITERKQLEEQLRQSQKMEAIGQLSGGVAHDFNNLLTGIIGNLSLAEMKAPEEIRDNLKEATKATNRAGELVKQLLAFSRKSQVELKPADLNRLVKETFQLARQTIDRRIDMDLQIVEDYLYILADEAQINSLIMNLLVNARDAIAEVMDGERDDDTFLISIRTSIQTGEAYAVIRVSDNGIGMDRETRERIFEPFYTTTDLANPLLNRPIFLDILKFTRGILRPQ